MTDNFKTVSLIILTALVCALVVVVGLVLMIMASESARAAEGAPIMFRDTFEWRLIGYLIYSANLVIGSVALWCRHYAIALMSFMIAALTTLVLALPAKAQENWWQRPAIRACCSDADAVYADEWTIHPDGSVSAVVTGGGPRGHTWAPIGRRYEVPRDKIRDREGNPTGRPLLFINPNNLPHVYCFVPGVMT